MKAKKKEVKLSIKSETNGSNRYRSKCKQVNNSRFVDEPKLEKVKDR